MVPTALARMPLLSQAIECLKMVAPFPSAPNRFSARTSQSDKTTSANGEVRRPIF